MKSILLGVFVAFALLAAGATAQSAPNTLGKIKAAKAINVAFSGDSLPFSYVADGNKPAGYSIDLCQRVIGAIGSAVGEPDLKCELLWEIGIRYDDGGYGTITQTQAPALRIGDRARVTDTGLELVPRR